MDVRRTFSVSVRLSNDLIESGFVVSTRLRAALRAELARLDSNFDVHCHPVSWPAGNWPSPRAGRKTGW